MVFLINFMNSLDILNSLLSSFARPYRVAFLLLIHSVCCIFSVSFCFPWCVDHNIIIIIMSFRQHGYPWPSLATLSLSFIASGRFSGLHSVSSLSCWYVCSSWPSCFCTAICGGTSVMSSSLLLQQCPACLVRLTRSLYNGCPITVVPLMASLLFPEE